MDALAIRPLRASDPAQMAAAFAAIGWSKPTSQFERYFAEQDAGRRHVLVATLDAGFAGYVTLNRHPTYPPFDQAHIPEIQDLNVLPQFQRNGIGSALLEAVEAVAWETSGTVGICVGVAPDYGAAQRIYIRRGYLPDGRGLVWRNRVVSYGEEVLVDDDLVLCLTKDLGGSKRS